MQLVLLDGIDPGPLRDVLGDAAYARGQEYLRQRRVLHTEWFADGRVLSGLVRGSGGRVYEVELDLVDGPRGRLLITGGICGCPLGGDCKHVAAVALAVAAGSPRRADARPVGQNWTGAFDALLDDGRRAAAAEERTAIALEISLQQRPAPPPRPGAAPGVAVPRLAARLVRPGRGGWVVGGLSWSKLAHPWQVGEYRPAHVRLLHELYALYTTRAGAPRYAGYGDDKVIDLAEIDSRHLWSLLDEAADLGLRIVHARKALGDVARHGAARVALDVTGGDPLVVAPRLLLDPGRDELPADPVPVRFIGADGHGVVWVSANQVTNCEAGLWRLGLARLAAPVPAALQQLALAGRHLTVPAAERARFDVEIYPRLRALATVESSDGAWSPPPISAPTLALRAAYGPDHALDLTWEWHYEVGGRTLRSPLAPTGDGHRDRAAERAALAALDAPLETVGLRADGELVPRAQLGGLQTMRFTTEVLPLLADASGVRVEYHGRPPAYRDAGDSLRIAVSADQVDGGTDWFDLGVEVRVDGRAVPFAELFQALALDEPHLLLPDGTYFSLDKPELRTLRTLIEEARALQDTPSAGLRISRFQAGLWEELAALGVVERQAAAWREQVRGLLSTTALPDPDVPEGLQADLRPYQREGLAWLQFLWQARLGGILADDMGLGKTVQALALLCHARSADPDAPPFLVVAPTSVLPNWAAEAARFAPDLRVVTLGDTLRRRGEDLATATDGADVVLTTYTLLRLDADAHAAHRWSGLVLDEAQHAKNHRSKVYQSARRVQAPFKLAITGTPMENDLMELWSLLSITAPGLFPHPTRFREHFALPIEKEGDAERLAALRRRIRPLVTRRSKEQVAVDLPAKQQQVLAVELDAKHRRTYQRHLQRERQKVLGLIDDVDRNRFTILRSLTLLRRLALHPGLVDDGQAGAGSAKIDALIEHLAEVVASGHRALVFSQFTGYLALVRDALHTAGIDHAYLDGATRNRGAVVQDFRDGAAPVFLISLKAGGSGLNLAEADYVFLLDPWWNPAVEAQAIDRAHRIGQTRTVHVYRLIAADTIEEKVLALAARKAELVAGVLDTGDPFDGRLGAEDIRALLA